MIRSVIKINLLLLMCFAMSCNKPAFQPTYAVCSSVDKFPAITAAGYDFVEVTVGGFLVPGESDSAFLVNLNQMKQFDAKIISCINFIPRELSIVGPDTKHEEIKVWADSAFRRAQMAGISYIVFGSGGARKVPEGFDRQQATEQFTALCKALGPLAEKYGIIVVVEPLNTGETNLINSLAEGAKVVEDVNHPNIRLLCDIYHMLREDESAEEIIKYGALIHHCHIAEKETRSAPGIKGDDFSSYFNALKKIKYQGCVSIEARWNDDFDQQIAPALQYMRQQFESL